MDARSTRELSTEVFQWQELFEKTSSNIAENKKKLQELYARFEREHLAYPSQFELFFNKNIDEIEETLSRVDHFIVETLLLQLITIQPQTCIEIINRGTEPLRTRLLEHSVLFLSLFPLVFDSPKASLFCTFLIDSFDSITSYEIQREIHAISSYANQFQAEQISQQLELGIEHHLFTEMQKGRNGEDMSYTLSAVWEQSLQTIFRDALHDKSGWQERLERLCGRMEESLTVDYKRGRHPLPRILDRGKDFSVDWYISMLLEKLEQESGNENIIRRLTKLIDDATVLAKKDQSFDVSTRLKLRLIDAKERLENDPESLFTESSELLAKVRGKIDGDTDPRSYAYYAYRYRDQFKEVSENLLQYIITVSLQGGDESLLTQLESRFEEVTSLTALLLSTRNDQEVYWTLRDTYSEALSFLGGLSTLGDARMQRLMMNFFQKTVKLADPLTFLVQQQFAELALLSRMEMKQGVSGPLSSNFEILHYVDPMHPNDRSYYYPYLIDRKRTLNETRNAVVFQNELKHSKTSVDPYYFIGQRPRLEASARSVLSLLAGVALGEDIVDDIANNHQLTKNKIIQQSEVFDNPAHLHFIPSLGRAFPKLLNEFVPLHALTEGWRVLARGKTKKMEQRRGELSTALAQASTEVLRPSQGKYENLQETYQASRSLDRLVEEASQSGYLQDEGKLELSAVFFTALRNEKNRLSRKNSVDHDELRIFIRGVLTLSKLDKPKGLTLMRLCIADLPLPVRSLQFLLSTLYQENQLHYESLEAMRLALEEDSESASLRISKLFQELGGSYTDALNIAFSRKRKDIDFYSESALLLSAKHTLQTIGPVTYEIWRSLDDSSREKFAASLQYARGVLFSNQSFATISQKFFQQIQSLQIDSALQQSVLNEVLLQAYPDNRPKRVREKEKDRIVSVEIQSKEIDRPQDLADYSYPQAGYEVEMKRTINAEIIYAQDEKLRTLVSKWIVKPNYREEKLANAIEQFQLGNIEKKKIAIRAFVQHALSKGAHKFDVLKVRRLKDVQSWSSLVSNLGEFFGVGWRDGFEEIYQEAALDSHTPPEVARTASEYIDIFSPEFDSIFEDPLHVVRHTQQNVATIQKESSVSKAVACRLLLSKSGASFLAAESAGRCNASDLLLWKRPDFWHGNVVNERNVLVGNVMFYRVSVNDQPAVLLGGFNPLHGFVESITPESFFESVLDAAAQFARKNSLTGGVYITEQGGMRVLSNREEVAIPLANVYHTSAREVPFKFRLGHTPSFVTSVIYKAR